MFLSRRSSLFWKLFSLDDSFGEVSIARRQIHGECKKKSPVWDACAATTATDRSLKSNDLAHFADFYPLLARPTTSRFIASGAEDSSFDEEDSDRALDSRSPIGLCEVIGFQGGATICDDAEKIHRDREIAKILLLAFRDRSCVYRSNLLLYILKLTFLEKYDILKKYHKILYLEWHHEINLILISGIPISNIIAWHSTSILCYTLERNKIRKIPFWIGINYYYRFVEVSLIGYIFFYFTKYLLKKEYKFFQFDIQYLFTQMGDLKRFFKNRIFYSRNIGQLQIVNINFYSVKERRDLKKKLALSLWTCKSSKTKCEIISNVYLVEIIRN